MRNKISTTLAAVGLLSFGGAQAALIDNLDGTVTDDVSNLMWTKDANLAASNTFGLAYNTDLGDYPGDSFGPSYDEQILADGSMTWGAALHWIDAMNAANYLGYNDWRLPTVIDLGNDGCNFAYTGTDCGYNVDLSTGELADLWYRALGNTPYFDTSGIGPQASWGLNNTGPFTNMQSNVYWSGTESAPNTENAWDFNTIIGSQTNDPKDNPFYGWAVRAGNAGGEGQAPLPGTVLLIGLGALGLRLARRRLG